MTSFSFVTRAALAAVLTGLVVVVGGESALAAVSPKRQELFPNGRPTVQTEAANITITQVNTSDKTPVLSGTMPAGCTDLYVDIYDDTYQTYSYVDSTVDAGFTLPGNGTWSVDLGASSTSLGNGWYNVFLYSECGAGPDDFGYYDYADASIYVYPAGCDASCVPVHRFYNTKNGVHFYTATEHEKLNVLYQSNYRYEGISSFAKAGSGAGFTPVHRFYNFKQGVHFYTANQAEATHVNNTASHTYRYEGIAYYTSTTQIADTTAVHRFYNFKQGVHFFTSNQAEASYVNDTAVHLYRYEGTSSYNFENK